MSISPRMFCTLAYRNAWRSSQSTRYFKNIAMSLCGYEAETYSLILLSGDLINQQGFWVRYTIAFGNERVGVLRIATNMMDRYYWRGSPPSDETLIAARLLEVY